MLAPLPATRFELSDWKTAIVQFNYHISVDGMLYSVPYEYIKKKVDVKVTDTTIEIFYNHNRIASHRCLKGRPGQQYSTVMEHMPEDHQKYLEWNGDRFCIRYGYTYYLFRLLPPFRFCSRQLTFLTILCFLALLSFCFNLSKYIFFSLSLIPFFSINSSFTQ